jgi:uncharacterized protein
VAVFWKMRFKINQIGDEGLAVDVPVTEEWLAAACPDLDVRPASSGLVFRGRLAKSGDDFLLRGDVRGSLETPCARCLEPARVDVQAPLAVTFVPRDVGSDAGRELDEEDDPDVVMFGGGEIDVSDEVRDEILLAIPVGPLCSPTCRGLCAVCGGNRNLVPCDCVERQRQGESKLAALARLKV